jgi:hypothetical protein
MVYLVIVMGFGGGVVGMGAVVATTPKLATTGRTFGSDGALNMTFEANFIALTLG